MRLLTDLHDETGRAVPVKKLDVLYLAPMDTAEDAANRVYGRQIDDIVLRQVQARLDQEEVRLSRDSPVE